MNQLPDFGEMGAQIAAREEQERIAREQAQAAHAAAMERATQRAFKGIYSRPLRKLFLKGTLARAESAGALDTSGGENGSGA